MILGALQTSDIGILGVNKMKHQNKRSLFTSYLVSYFGIVVLSCAIISMIFLNLYVSDLKRQQEKSVREKAALALNDIERQFDSFYYTSLKVSIQKVYWPSYFESNKYYEIMLLDDFVQYKGHSLICNEYFLNYYGNNTVFHSSGSTKLFSAYMKSLGISDEREALKRINACEAFEIICFDRLDMNFVLYLVNTVDDMKAVLIFVIYNMDLRERIQSSTGGLVHNYSIYYKEHHLLSHNFPRRDAEETKLLEAST